MPHVNSTMYSIGSPRGSMNVSFGDQVSEVHCNKCDLAFDTMRLLNIHLLDHHTEHPCHASQAPSDIPQYDGNITLISDVSDVMVSPLPIPQDQSSEVATHDHTLLSPNKSETSGSMELNYRINQVNQARRLYENTSRPVFDIRYNNLQIINGIKCHTNVSIDCNSGAYLTAVKPALEAIVIGWQHEIHSTLITCEDYSDRKDMSGRKVFTKLVLFLTERCSPAVKSKAVVHFYHTSCTIQVQGSSILSCGKSSPVWFVNHFLEPLARAHASQNSVEISAMNKNIRQSAQSCCAGCKALIKPCASQPKDQELGCNNCGKLFHKRCTDRKKSTANWKKEPWYCEGCIMGTNLVTESANSTSHPLNCATPSDNTRQLQTTPLDRFISLNSLSAPTNNDSDADADINGPQQTPVTRSESRSQSMMESLPPPSIPADTAPQQTSAQNVPPSPLPSVTLGPVDSSSTSTDIPSITSSSISLPREVTSTGMSAAMMPPPVRAGRQRGTNIALENPEYEFQKTALNACRSTIAQQETELKSLREALDIRNKRILQLENQIGHASQFIAGREPPTHNEATENHLESILVRIKSIEDKMLSLSSPHASHNIVLNTCNTSCKKPVQMQTISTQTDKSCEDCDFSESSNNNLMEHTETQHSHNESASDL